MMDKHIRAIQPIAYAPGASRVIFQSRTRKLRPVSRGNKINFQEKA